LAKNEIKNTAFVAALHFTATVGSPIIGIKYTLKRMWKYFLRLFFTYDCTCKSM